MIVETYISRIGWAFPEKKLRLAPTTYLSFRVALSAISPTSRQPLVSESLEDAASIANAFHNKRVFKRTFIFILMEKHPHIELYLHTMKAVCPELQDHHLVEFSESLEIRTFEKNEFLFPAGTVQEHVVFVAKGLARVFYIDQKGDEKTTWFVKDQDFATDYPCFLSGEKSQYTVQCLEACETVWLPKHAIYKGYSTHPELEKYGRLIAEEVIRQQQERIASFLFKNAKQRYLDFLANSSPLLNRISVGQLASYLGIERQSLTRIRKEILEEK